MIKNMPMVPVKLVNAFIIAAAFLCAGVPSRADVTGRPHDLRLENPQGHCLNCHDLHQTSLGEGYPHNLKRANEMGVCYQCHAGSMNDYTTIDPTLPNRTTMYSRYDIMGEFAQEHGHFPDYGMDGEHNKCSHCHNPHGVFDHTSTTRKPKLLSAGPDAVTDTDEYCFVCHNSDPNPPHAKFPNISVGVSYRLSRNIYRQMTHSTFFRSSTISEPVPDTARTYDDNPYGAGKDISCLTCHRPHGSPNEHMLKSVDDQNFCLECHDGSKAASLTIFTTSGHGKAGVRRICQECHFPHGTGQENAVKRTIKDSHTGTENLSNISSLGMNEVCFACHGSAGVSKYYAGKASYNAGVHKTVTSIRNHNPSDTEYDQKPGDCGNCHGVHGKGYTKMLVGPSDQSLCYVCHNEVTKNTASGRDVKAEFQSGSHHDLSKVQCRNCHNVHKATRTSAMMDPYSSLKDVADNKTFCLKCHAGRMPSGVTGAQDINTEWANAGHDKTHVMLCSDCHESHGSPNSRNLNYSTKVYNGYSAKFRPGMVYTSRAFCELCHNRSGAGYKGAKRIPVEGSYVSQHDSGDSTLCTDCHSQKHNPTLGGSYYTSACLDCHKQGVGNPYAATDTDFNTPTVPGDLNVYTSIHNITYSPPGTVDCSTCHGSNHETDHSESNKIKDPDPANGSSGAMPSIRSSNVFCLECHDTTPVSIGGISPSNIKTTWTNGGHDTTHSMFCSDCHEYHRSYNKGLINYRTVINGTYSATFVPGTKTAGRDFCELCHNRDGSGFKGAKVIPVGIQYVAQHEWTDATPCLDCHKKKHDPKLGNYTGSSAYYTVKCLDCHTQGKGNPYPNPDADLNTPANPADAGLMLSVHDVTYSPPSNVDCTKCHGPNHETDHSAANKLKDPDPANGVSGAMPSWQTSNTFCLECHDSTPVGIGGKQPVNILDTYTSLGHGSAEGGRQLCYDCHQYHGSESIRLLKRTVAGQTVMSIYSGNNTSFCIACHRGYDPRTPQWTGYSVYSGSVHAFGNLTTGNLATDGRHGPGSCVNCHNPHGAEQDGVGTGSMTARREENLCYTCHSSGHPNTASGDDVQARFQMRTHHNVSDADQLGADGIEGTADDSKIECEDCHDPHAITERLMAFRCISDAAGRKIEPIEADQEFCIKCHSPSPQEGVKYPAAGVWDKTMYLNSAHGNDKKRLRAFGNYSNGITYPCKVCHNPHGSEQAAMQRETWDINRDGLPDDIDGDGVLESTNLVGFIGYSTGTRKPILVNTTAGIPSRSTFRRVSSTIPKQGNGTIDIELCLICHDGSPAYDVRTDSKKRSHHPVEFSQQSSLGGAKIFCYTCHDQHRAQARNDAAGEYPTTNPYPPREPMPGDAPFCLKCHDNTLPDGVSFGSMTGSHRLKNIKLSYNPTDRRDANGYDLLTSHRGHFVQATGEPMLCRDCHNQHGSDYTQMLRDNTEPGKPNYDPSQPMQLMQPLTLRQDDPLGGGDSLPVTSVTEHCLACHSGVTTYNGSLIPLPPPPDADVRGFSMAPVARHPDLRSEVTSADETNMHIYKSTFALVTTPGSVKEDCTVCHDSHNPYIATIGGEIADCYQCHNTNTSLPDAQSEFNDNPLNPTRSKSIHPIKYDPSANNPASIECLKCHDQSKHMRGTVRLRKDPTQFDNYTVDSNVWADPIGNRTINQFCLECHAPDTTVASSFWRGGTEHVPPRLPAGHSDSAHVQEGNLLCSDCHEYHGSRSNGLKKDELPGEEETFCYNCHDNPAKSMGGVDIEAKFASASRHAVSDADQSKGGKLECSDCHNPHTSTRANPAVSPQDKTTPVADDDAFCISCHDSSGAPGVKFLGFTLGTSAPEWKASSGSWNRWDKSAFGGSQHQAGGVGCRSCHDAHGSSNYALLLPNISSSSGIDVSFGMHSTARGKRKEELGINSACAACHKNAMGVYDGYGNYTSLTFGHRRGVDKNCTYCHNPHGTGQANMIRSNKPLYMNMTAANYGSVYNFKGFDNPTTGSPYYSFCSSRSCHKGTGNEGSRFDVFNMNYQSEPGGLSVDNYSKDETTVSHHPIREGVIGCTSCHKEHGTSTISADRLSPDLRAPYYGQSNWPATWHSGSGPYQTVSNSYLHQWYYYYQANPSSFDGRNYWEYYQNHRNSLINPATPDNANDLCFMCHMKDDIIGTAIGGMTGTNTNFRGHEAVKGGAANSQDISRKGSGLGSDYHNFSCSQCHYAHASRKGKLLRHSCFSQYNTPSGKYYDYNYGGNVIVFNCHAYKAVTGTWNTLGWRDLLMSPAKSDFKRPPNPVTNLSVTGTDQDQLTVSLSWTAVADAPGVKADHYNVYRYSQPITESTKPYASRINKGANGSGGNIGTAMSFTDTTCQPYSSYYYAVVACDAENNESLVSNTVPAPALGSDHLSPQAISNQQVVQQAGSRNVTISWSDPGDNVNVAQYRVYRKVKGTPLTTEELVSDNLLTTKTDTSLSADGSPDAVAYSHTDSTVEMGSTYAYAVIAVDNAGNASALPTGSTFVINDIDPAPAPVTLATAKPVTKAMQSSLTWTAPANEGSIKGYHVYRKAGSALTQSDLVPSFRIISSVNAVSATDSNVPLTGTDYYYSVTALDTSSGRESLLGNSLSVNIPTPPTGLSVTKLADSQFQLNWTAPSLLTNLQYYNVYTRRNGGAWTQRPVLGGANTITYNPGFESGTTYWYTSSYVTISSETSTYTEGAKSIKAIITSAGDRYVYYSSYVTAMPSTSYTYSGYINIPVSLTGGTAALRIIEYNSSGGYVTEHTGTGISVTSGWQKLTDTWTTNANTGRIYVRLQVGGVGTVYWDDIYLSPNVATGTTGKVDLSGTEPGSCDFAVTARYSTYAGVSPYESNYSSTANASITDTEEPESFTVTAALTEASNYTRASAEWDAPADRNFTGYTPEGVSYYTIESSSDQGKSWKTALRSNLSNPGFEQFTGTADDSTEDTFTNWSKSQTYTYAVTDSFCDSKAMKIKWNGSGDRYITSAEPDTGQSVANKTYSLSFWAKANKSATYQFFIQENGGNYETVGVTSPAIGTGWQRFTSSGTFASSPFATSARVVIRPSSDTTAEITVDAVRLESGTGALDFNDGSFFQTEGYNVPGTRLAFNDLTTQPDGSSVKYRVKAVDVSGNATPAALSNTLNTKPTRITDLAAAPSAASTANVIAFSTPVTLSGVSQYDVYSKQQAVAFTNLSGATLIGTFAPARTKGGNIASEATAEASHTYSTYVATNAIDGNSSTYWAGTTATAPQTLTLTFPSAVNLYKVSFDFGSSTYYRPKDFLVQTYEGSAWVTQNTVTGNTSQSPTYTFARPVSTTKVRISITQTYNINSYRPYVYEFQVYPGETFTHDEQNTAMHALPGQTYAYAVTATDVNGLVSDLSTGGTTTASVPDRTGPDKVTDLSVMSPVGTVKAVLTWRKPQDNYGYGSGAATYEVYQLPTTYNGTPVPVTEANYQSATLVHSGTYPPGPAGGFVNYTATWYDHLTAYYGVRSADASGNWSSISNSEKVIIGKDVEAPVPPTITACIAVTSPEVDIYWTHGTDNVGITGYRLYRADAGEEPFLTDQCITETNIGQAAEAITYIDYSYNSIDCTGGTPGHSYYYALRAWDYENNMSNISNCGYATVKTVATDTRPPEWPAPPPELFTVTQGYYPDIDLVWRPATDLDDSDGQGAIDSYEIYRSGQSFSAINEPGVTRIAIVSGMRNSFIDDTGVPDTTYYYAVAAVDASANGNRSPLTPVISATVMSAPQPDNTPPTVPGNLTAATGVYPYLNLTWTASTDANGLSHYILYRSDYPRDITDANKDNPAEVTKIMIANDATGYTATGTDGATYNFRLEAFDLAWNRSGMSAQVIGQVAAAPCQDVTPPSAPSGLVAIIGPSPDIDLSWTAAHDNGGGCASLIDQYRLYRSTSEITGSTDLSTITPIYVAGNSTTYVDSSGLPNTSYWYTMTAVDSGGNESARSNIIATTTAADTLPPAAVSDLLAASSAGSVLLTWCKSSDNVGVDHYDIYRMEKTTILTDADLVPENRIYIHLNHGTCLSYTDTGVISGKTYSYAIIAVDGAGNRSTISRGRNTGDTIATVP